MGKPGVSIIDPSPNDKLSGKHQSLECSKDIVSLLVKEGHVSPLQVSHARRVREKLDSPRTLLDVLKSNRLICPKVPYLLSSISFFI